MSLGASDTKANETKGDFKANAGKALPWAGKEVWFEPPRAGKYAFTLNAADPMAPVLTIAPRD